MCHIVPTLYFMGSNSEPVFESLFKYAYEGWVSPLDTPFVGKKVMHHPFVLPAAPIPDVSSLSFIFSVVPVD